VSIFCKVRLADLVFVRKEAEWDKAHFNRIQAKHIDFIVCDITTSAVRLAIELDDRSHDRADRRDRDAFVDKVLAGVGITLLRFRAQSNYNVRGLSSKLAALLGRKRRDERQLGIVSGRPVKTSSLRGGGGSDIVAGP
jgi:very-short-patch-repair endonuclease